MPDVERIENGIEVPTDHLDEIAASANSSCSNNSISNEITTHNYIIYSHVNGVYFVAASSTHTATALFKPDQSAVNNFLVHSGASGSRLSEPSSLNALSKHFNPDPQQQQQQPKSYTFSTSFANGRDSSDIEQDETDLFFAAMAQCVKKLPPGERAKLRIKIGAIVGAAEIKFYQDRTDGANGLSANTIGHQISTPISNGSDFSRSYEDLYNELKEKPNEHLVHDKVVYVPWSDNN